MSSISGGFCAIGDRRHPLAAAQYLGVGAQSVAFSRVVFRLHCGHSRSRDTIAAKASRMTKLGNLEDHFVHFFDHRRGRQIPVVSARLFRRNLWDEIWAKPPFQVLKPALFRENVGECPCYSALIPLPTADFRARNKPLNPALRRSPSICKDR